MATTSMPLFAAASHIGNVGEAVLVVPRAAVHVEQDRERPGALRLVDAGHQLPLRGAPEFDVPHLDFERAAGL